MAPFSPAESVSLQKASLCNVDLAEVLEIKRLLEACVQQLQLQWLSAVEEVMRVGRTTSPYIDKAQSLLLDLCVENECYLHAHIALLESYDSSPGACKLPL